MKKNMFILSVVLTCFVLLLFSTGYVFAEESFKESFAKKYQDEKDICNVVKKSIMDGLSTKDVTKTSIQMGHDACLVIQCAIDANGKLEDIIKGALEAGATSDVCSRCAIEAGADIRELALILETLLGYTPPLAVLTPVEAGLPGEHSGGGSLSPYIP